MIILLLVITFAVAFGVATIIVLAFNRPIDGILKRIVPPELSYAWARYLRFAIYVVGIAGGVQVWNLEKYLTVQQPATEIVQLTSERWMLEIYNTVIGTLQSAAILLLVFFVFALIAIVIVQLFESRTAKTSMPK